MSRRERVPRRRNGVDPNPSRSVRIGDATWTAADVRAQADDVTMSFLIVRFVEAYAAGLVGIPPAAPVPAAQQS